MTIAFVVVFVTCLFLAFWLYMIMHLLRATEAERALLKRLWKEAEADLKEARSRSVPKVTQPRVITCN